MDLLRESKINSILVNMVAITHTEQDRNYIENVIKSSAKKNLINSKEAERLMREVNRLRKK